MPGVYLNRLYFFLVFIYFAAAAAAADPFHLEMVFSEPFVASTWNTGGRFDAKSRPMRPLNGSQIVQKSISNRHKVGF